MNQTETKIGLMILLIDKWQLNYGIVKSSQYSQKVICQKKDVQKL